MALDPQHCHLGETGRYHHNRRLCVACDYFFLCSQYVLRSSYRCVPEALIISGRCARRYGAGTIFSTVRATFLLLRSIRLGSFYLERIRTYLSRSSYRTDKRTRRHDARGGLCLAHFDALGFATLWGDRHVWTLASSVPSSERVPPLPFFMFIKLRRNATGTIGPILGSFSHRCGNTSYSMCLLLFSHVTPNSRGAPGLRHA
jgi:hypothetical protein